MAQITINKIGTSPQQLEKGIKFQFITVKEGLKSIGTGTRDHMRNTIKTSKKRPGGRQNLENSIKVHVEQETDKGTVVGVGKITSLNRLAPYWRLINYGGFSAVAIQGKKVPGFFGDGDAPQAGHTGDQEFFYTPNNINFKTKYFMIPKKPIQGILYVEKAFTWANTITRVHFANWTKQINIFTQ